jgi:RHS repeat-associated protein
MPSNGDFYANTQWGFGNPVDPLYPELASSELVTVVAGAGPTGENVLDVSLGDRDYVGSGAVLGGFGSNPDPRGGASWWDATQGCLSVSYHFTTEAWNQAIYNPLLIVGQHLYYWDVGFTLEANIPDWQTTSSQAQIILGYGTDTDWIYRDTFQLTRAQTENQWQTFTVRWKAGTISGNSVAPDGWIRVYWNGTVIYDVSNIRLLLSWSQFAPGGRPNQLRTIWLGYYGLFGPTTNLVLTDGGDPANGSAEDILYFHRDAIGSVRMLTDRTQTVQARYDHLPFGSNWSTTGTARNSLKFVGKERDTETAGGSAWPALDYSIARYYQSQIGRFTTVDPGHVGAVLSDPQSWNGYAYAYNNPLRFADPTGLGGDCLGGYDEKSGQCQYFPLDFFVESFTRLGRSIQEAAEPVKNWLLAPRDPQCMATFAVGGSIVGAGLGGAVGVVTGPGEAVLVPAGSMTGTIGGQIVGLGQCMSAVNAGGGASSGRSSPGMTQWGWKGGRAWKDAVKRVKEGGTIEDIGGKIPSKNEALELLKEAGAKVDRIQGPHSPPNPHVYDHINFTTSSGLKGTLRIGGL